MPTYSYAAKTLKGETRSGLLEAEDKRQLARILREEGYVLISAISKEKGRKKKKFTFSIPFLSRVSLTEKIMFTRNLQVMVGAGVSLPRSLKILSAQTKNKKFKRTILSIREEIIRGKNFSKSLGKYPDVFSELFVSMIKVGEEAGTLEEVLEVLTNQMEKDHQLRSKVKGAMMYPVVIVSAMFGIGILMMIMVVPKLAKVFSDLKMELPVTTKFILNSGSFMAEFWYVLIGGIFVFLVLAKMAIKTKTGKLIKDSFLLKMPILSPIVRKTNSASTVRTLSSLIAAGVPIVKALEVTSGTLSNVYYQEALVKAAEELKKGNKLSETLERRKDIYPILVIQMIKVGEETGETATILKKLADFYEEEVSNITENLSSIIEPILMLIIGAAVGFFAISIIQPIYGMMQGF